MEQTFLTELRIEKVRHLKDITIPLSQTERKNLILTGKNGSGKTSVLNALANTLSVLVSVPSDVQKMNDGELKEYLSEHMLRNGDWANDYWKAILSRLEENTKRPYLSRKIVDSNLNSAYPHLTSDLEKVFLGLKCSVTLKHKSSIYTKYKNGHFVVAYYGDNRKLDIDDADHIEKIHLKPFYGISEKPARNLGKYLVDLESTKAFAQAKGNISRSLQIEEWFKRFESVLRRIYSEPNLKLDFDIENFKFSILIDGREPFDFNTMSMGYAAVFDIVADLMMRMESQRRYDLEGIVLIDEIETHLHVELQKQIVPILTELFPNIQFILTTHSPFILNSAPNAVIYDLEKHLLVSEGMENLSYEGIVEGYFGVDRFSQKLRRYFEEYKRLVTSEELSDLDYARIAELEDYLDEVPDYLALDLAHEYSRLKAEFDS